MGYLHRCYRTRDMRHWLCLDQCEISVGGKRYTSLFIRIYEFIYLFFEQKKTNVSNCKI
jgi:hypothetical protein